LAGSKLLAFRFMNIPASLFMKFDFMVKGLSDLGSKVQNYFSILADANERIVLPRVA